MQNYTRRNYQDGDVIFSQNQRAGEAYLITSGQVRLEVEDNGTTKEIDKIGKGSIFGEMGVISDTNRMASAISIGTTDVLTCSRLELNDQLDKLDKDRRDAITFLILYSQDLLPFELMEKRPSDEKAYERDKIAYYLVQNTDSVDDLDIFLMGLYKVLIKYAKRRLPPDFKPTSE